MTGLTEKILKKEPILALSALFLATATGALTLFQPLIQTARINISSPAIDQLAWVTQVQWNVDRIETPPESLAEVMKAAVAAEVSKFESVSARSRRTAIRRAAPAWKPAVTKRKSIQAIQVVRAIQAAPATPPAAPTYEERIREIRNAMDGEYFSEAPLAPLPIAVDAYYALRRQFQVALDIQETTPEVPAEQLAIQTAAPERSDALAVLAASAVARVESLEASEPVKPSVSKPKRRRARVTVRQLEKAAPSAAQVTTVAEPVSTEPAAGVSSQVTGYSNLKNPVIPVQPTSLPTSVAESPVTTQTLTETIRELKVDRPVLSASAAEPTPFPRSGLIDLEQVFPSRPMQPVVAPAPVSQPIQLLPKPSAFNSATKGVVAAAPVTTQPVAQPSPPVTTQPVPSATEYSGQQGLLEEPVDSTRSSMAAAVQGHTFPFFEAMDVRSEVHGVSSSILSYEGSAAAQQARWMTSEAPGYLPTLALRQVEAQGTPMLSHTGLHWIGLDSKVRQQKEAGVVYLKLAPQWSVKLSARAESAVSLDGEGHLQAESKTDATEFAVYLNVEPGGHLVHLSNSELKYSGSVGIPVLPGTMTFLDLSEIAVKAVSGMVLDAGAGKQARPLANAHVSTVDRTKTSFTSADGRFVLKNVVTVGDHPVVIESDDAVTGFTHRYQLEPSGLNGAFLFRFGTQQCQDWIGQLEGGVSPKSGLLVAAVPEVLKGQPDLRVFPATAPIFSNSTLAAETYTLSAAGFLKPKTELSNDSARYVSVQLSDGYHLTQLKTPEGQIVWSSLVRVSPDVISVVRSR